jgi:hypothetical protein
LPPPNTSLSTYPLPLWCHSTALNPLKNMLMFDLFCSLQAISSADAEVSRSTDPAPPALAPSCHKGTKCPTLYLQLQIYQSGRRQDTQKLGKSKVAHTNGDDIAGAAALIQQEEPLSIKGSLTLCAVIMVVMIVPNGFTTGNRLLPTGSNFAVASMSCKGRDSILLCMLVRSPRQLTLLVLAACMLGWMCFRRRIMWSIINPVRTRVFSTNGRGLKRHCR